MCSTVYAAPGDGHWVASYEASGISSGEAGFNLIYKINPDGTSMKFSEPFAFDHKTNGYSDPFTPRESLATADLCSYYTYQYSNSGPAGNASDLNVNATSYGEAGKARYNPTVKVVWTWVPNAGQTAQESVPEYLNFLVKGDVSAATNVDTANNTRQDYVGSNSTVSWGDPDSWKGTSVLSIDGLIVQDDATETINGNSSSWRQVGSKLFSIKTEGRTRIDETTITLLAEGAIKGGRYRFEKQRDRDMTVEYPMIGTASATGSVLATLDDRAVTISSSTIEPSYYKTTAPPPGTNPNSLGPFPERQELHVPTVLGAKNTDSVARLNDGLWRAAPVHFSADNVGNWNRPSFDWSITGENVPSTGYVDPRQEHSSSLTYGFNFGPDGNSFPKSSTVKATVTDADGIVGENTFDIKWHLEYEKTADLPDGDKRKDVYWMSPDHIPPQQGTSVATVPARSFDYGAAIDGVFVLADLAHVPGASELEKVFSVVTSISSWGETQEENHITDSQILNTGKQFKQALRDYPDNIEGMTVALRQQYLALSDSDADALLNDYVCFVGRVRVHRQKNYLADKYDSHGYVDANHHFYYDSSVLNGTENQLFYRIGAESPAPGTGDREIPPSYNLG